MRKTNPFLLSAVLLVGLTAGCGQKAASADDDAEKTSASETMSETATPENYTAMAMPVGDDSAAEQAAAATLKSLPLKRGFYVSSDTPCNQASNATLRLVTREGINWARDICTFKKIEKTGATSYSVTESCSGEPQPYEIPNDTSFTVKYDGGSESSARYCAQSSLPDPWRDNDISDITG